MVKNKVFLYSLERKATKYFGRMAERSKAAVLKTVDVRASWGSNPYSSAKDSGQMLTFLFSRPPAVVWFLR